jgi:hypothetical protein
MPFCRFWAVQKRAPYGLQGVLAPNKKFDNFFFCLKKISPCCSAKLMIIGVKVFFTKYLILKHVCKDFFLLYVAISLLALLAVDKNIVNLLGVSRLLSGSL